MFFWSAKLDFCQDKFPPHETFTRKIKLSDYMIPIRRLALGVGLASGALLTAWLLTGDRKTKTRQFIVRKGESVRNAIKSKSQENEDSEVHYYI